MFSLAVDTGPLYGPMTGVGRAVSEILHEYRDRSNDLEVIPYVVSRRASLGPGTRRLPFPAAFAMRAWSRSDFPRADRYLAPAQIVHGMNYVVPPARIPRVVSVYDTWALRNPGSCSPAVARAMQVLRRNIDTGAAVHTSSHATAEVLHEILPMASIHVIHLGAPRSNIGNVTRFFDNEMLARTPLEDGAPFVLAVGTIERRKNFVRLVDAFSKTNAARSGLRLVIAGGSGDDIGDVAAAIGRLDPLLRNRIVLLGRVDESLLEHLYLRATAVAYPSLDEGFGFPILEAMAHGVPCLGANRGSIPEIAGDAAILVDPMDVETMSTHIDRIVSDDALRTSLIRKGAEQCARFTWTATADALIGLYRSLVADSSIGRRQSDL